MKRIDGHLYAEPDGELTTRLRATLIGQEGWRAIRYGKGATSGVPRTHVTGRSARGHFMLAEVDYYRDEDYHLAHFWVGQADVTEWFAFPTLAAVIAFLSDIISVRIQER